MSSTVVRMQAAHDPRDAELLDQAKMAAAGLLEGSVYHRAKVGVKEPVYYRGEVVGHIRKPSDTLAMFWLKSHKPETYDRASEHKSLHLHAVGEIPTAQLEAMLACKKPNDDK